jgi:quercetin dioxygenase-like cupin family protein
VPDVPGLHIETSATLRRGSVVHALPELRNADVEGLILPDVEADAELALGRLQLLAGERLPLHHHDRAETIFVLEGSVVAQRGRGAAEITAPAAAYFPPGVPHAVTATAEGPATLLTCFSRGDRPAAIASELIPDGADDSGWPNPNRIAGEQPLYRWALAEEYEDWHPVEPTKGWRLKLRYLFDPHRGAPDLVVGVAENQPRTHYTLHHHAPAELYYVLDGSGVIYVGDEAYEVSRGSTVYVPADVTHGIDTGDERLRVWWVYGLERCGRDWVWEAVETVHPHSALADGTTRHSEAARGR